MATITEAGSPYPVEFTRTADKALRRLPDIDATRIAKAIKNVASTGQGQLEKMQDKTCDYRLRVGEYRVMLDVQVKTEKRRVKRGKQTIEESVEITTIFVLDVIRRTGTTYSKRK